MAFLSSSSHLPCLLLLIFLVFFFLLFPVFLFSSSLYFSLNPFFVFHRNLLCLFIMIYTPPFEPSITANIHHNSRPLFLMIGALFSLSSHPPHLLCFPCFIHRNFIRRFLFIGFHGVIGAFLLIRLLTEFYSEKTLRSLTDTPYSLLTSFLISHFIVFPSQKNLGLFCRFIKM